MASRIEEEKEALERIQELLDAFKHAHSPEEQQRIIADIKKLAMERLGVEGTA